MNLLAKTWIILVILGLFACDIEDEYSENVVEGEGAVISKEYQFDQFSTVEIKGAFVIELQPQAGHRVIVNAEENLQEQVSVSVENGVLTVKSDDRLESKSGIKVIIAADQITRMQLSGATTLNATDALRAEDLELDLRGAGEVALPLDVTTLYLKISGAGDVQLSGSASEAHIEIAGAGNLSAYEFQTHKLFLESAGASGAKVFADEYLSVKLRGVGSVSYRGNPVKIDQDIAGMGSLREG